MTATKAITVLILSRFFLPAFKSGGPVRSLTGLCQHLGTEFQFKVISLDRDSNSSAPFCDVSVATWNRRVGAEVYYLPPGPTLPLRLLRVMRHTEYDLLYLNSFFDPVFTLAPICWHSTRLVKQTPILVAPRGEFAPSALRQKPLRKKLALAVTQVLLPSSGLTWQASTKLEIDHIQRTVPKKARRLVEARDLVPIHQRIPLQEFERDSMTGPIRLIYLSRITPVKNLDFLLQALSHTNSPLHLSIVGPVSDNSYWEHCSRLIEILPSTVVVEYHGSVSPDMVSKTIAKADLFCLLSQGENFGHVVVEALSAGVPVLLSDQTPWRNLKGKGIGWDVPIDDPQRVGELLDRLARLSRLELSSLSDRCREFAQTVAADPEARAANQRMLRNALADSCAR